MILYPDCDLLNLNMIECDCCYRYSICSKSKENEMKKIEIINKKEQE